MLLLLEVFFVILPLLGIAGIVYQGWIATVDGLFTSLILLAVSGTFALGALLEFRARKQPAAAGSQAGKTYEADLSAAAARNGTITESGVVMHVSFYETHIGQPDRSAVMFRPDKTKEARMMFFLGNVRDHLPVGRRLAITYRSTPQGNDLLERQYL
jgi:hypothetical protein